MLTTPPNEVFEPPPDIFCQGRAMKQHVPGIPEFFSYTSEGIFYYEPPEILNKPPVYVVSTRTESYDYLQKVSRVVYKPIDFSNLDDPYAGNNQGFVSEVKDFSSGIMYLTWQNYGNCSARFIGNNEEAFEKKIFFGLFLNQFFFSPKKVWIFMEMYMLMMMELLI